MNRIFLVMILGIFLGFGCAFNAPSETEVQEQTIQQAQQFDQALAVCLVTDNPAEFDENLSMMLGLRGFEPADKVGETWGRIKEWFRRRGEEGTKSHDLFDELEHQLLEVSVAWYDVNDPLLHGCSHVSLSELDESLLRLRDTWEDIKREYR